LLKLRRGIVPDDGLLDVVVLRADGFVDSVRAVWELMRGGREGQPGHVGYARGKVVTVETQDVQPVELDGEAHGVTPFTAEIIPHAIRVLAPGRSA
jgi:diacylglycerol kinase family enzyme